MIGLAINGVLALLCLMVLVIYRHYSPLKYLALFYLTLAAYFLGFTIYGRQSSSEAIFAGYRLMLVALSLAPVAWIWFALSLQDLRPGRWAKLALVVGLVLALLLALVDHPVVLSPELHWQDHAKTWHPISLLIRPVVYAFGLVVVLITMILFLARRWPGNGRPAYVWTVLAGLSIWFLGGLHDAAWAMHLPTSLPGPVMWLGSVWLSLCLALALAFHLRGLNEALRRSEARFSKAFALNPEGLCVLDRAQGRFLEANQAFLNLLGRNSQEVLGRTVAELDFLPGPQPWEKVLQTLTQGEHLANRELDLRAAGGETRRVRWSAGAIDFWGVPAILVVTSDLTGSRRVERSLRQSQEKYRNILESIEDGYFEVDLAGNLTFFNDALGRLMGRDHTELQGLNYRDYMGAEDAKLVYQATNEVYTSGQASRIMGWTLRRPDGGLCEVETLVSPIRDEQGRVQGFRGIMRDLTQRRQEERAREQLERQLVQAQKMEAVGTLAGGIAHDFNNTLGAIVGYAELALESAQSHQDNSADLREILGAAERAGVLVRQILTFSRKEQVAFDSVDLNHEVNHVVQLLGRTLPKMIKLETSLAPDLPPVRANANQIEQVLLNLAGNARDAMPEGGRLRFETVMVIRGQGHQVPHPELPPGTYARLTISDTGQGIDESHLEHIFEPFFTTKGVGLGTGLGLSTVYGIIKGHNGHIACQSQAGQGTSFIIHLPM